MELGFVNFNNEEKQKVFKVLQIIRESQAIDELGIGRIRDAFSNLLFPGMSTLQHHAKYFAVLPSLYYQVSKGRYADERAVKKKIIDLEIILTQQLVNASSASDAGITGSGVISEAAHDSSKYVKYDPTYIYYNGMITYGMIKSRASLYRMILEQSGKHNDNPTRIRDNQNTDVLSDAAEECGESQIFATCGEKYTFDKTIGLSLELTYKEADYVKKHIENSEASRDSLLAYLLIHNIPILNNDGTNKFVSYSILGDIWDEYDIPDKYMLPYKLSVRFSKFVNLLRIRYKYLYDTLTEHVDSAMKMRELFDKTWSEVKSQSFDTEKIEEILTYCRDNHLVSEETIMRFCSKAALFIQDERWDELDEAIIVREKEVKGKERSKLFNYELYKNDKFTLQEPLTFRWELVRTMISEIRKGIEYGKR